MLIFSTNGQFSETAKSKRPFISEVKKFLFYQKLTKDGCISKIVRE
jgi:hypothetical protein